MIRRRHTPRQKKKKQTGKNTRAKPVATSTAASGQRERSSFMESDYRCPRHGEKVEGQQRENELQAFGKNLSAASG